jgi:hypothetical protein
MKKISVLLLLILLIVIPFFVLGGQYLFTLHGIQTHLTDFYQWRDQSPILAGGIFFLIYVIMGCFGVWF